MALAEGGRGRAQALNNAAIVHACRAEPVEAQALAEASIAEAERAGYVYRVAMGRVVRGWALATRGDHDAGLAELRAGIALSRGTGAMMDDAYYLGLLADAQSGAGRLADAHATLDEARAVLPRAGRFFWDAELTRLRGELLRAAGDRAGAAGEFTRAIASAREQEGLSLALRATLSLARLRAEEGRAAEGRELVARCYERFTEGFSSGDLRAAAALLGAAEGAPAQPA